MTAAVKARWVQALRSGGYPQGMNVLRRTLGAHTQYCCLGVLCEVVGAPKSDSGYEFDDEIWTNIVPGELVPDPFQSQLVDMNDTVGLTFPQIADWIETHIPTEEGA